VFHARVTAPPPYGRLEGVAVKLLIVGGAAATVTVTFLVLDPVTLVAVIVNVVVTDMEAGVLPLTATEPIP
jgi:hypothetical protein